MTSTTQQLVWRKFNMQGGTVYRAQEWTTEPSPEMRENKYTIFVLSQEITCFQNDKKLGTFNDLDQAMRAAEADFEANGVHPEHPAYIVRDAIVDLVDEYAADDVTNALVLLALAALVVSRRAGVPDTAAANTLWTVAQANPEGQD